MSAPEAEYNESADTQQNDYVSRPGQQKAGIPVVSDDAAEAGGYTDADQANSDQQLQADDNDAIDKSNIINKRTRGAQPEGTYVEPGDEEGLGGNDGRSRVAGGPN